MARGLAASRPDFFGLVFTSAGVRPGSVSAAAFGLHYWLASGLGQAWAIGRPRPPDVSRFMANPFQFLQDVRTEATKVTWPSRRETLITTILVILMVLVASLFFVAVDQGLRLIVTFILKLGH